MNTQTVPDTVSETTPEQLDAVLAAAHDAVGPHGSALPAERTARIRASADALDGAGDVLVLLADEETWLRETRLRGEAARSSGQLRKFGDALEDEARFQRPFCFQDIPAALLPEALRDENPLGSSRRMNGEVTRSWQGAA